MTVSPEIACYPHPDHAAADIHGKPMHLAIGMFDGVHLGHRQVLLQAIQACASQPGHFSAVLTFNPHPSCVLYPERATRMLMSLSDRIRRIHAAGIDTVFVQKFTHDYAQMDAGAFVPMLVEHFPLLQSIHVGENFRFGHRRAGTVDTLGSAVAEFAIELHVVDRKVLGGTAISSSRIRTALQEGAIAEVNAMLGEPYMAHGRVIPGKGVGRKINIPTLNIPWEPEVTPRFGVYRVILKHILSGETFNGIANYGVRPTVETASNPVLEVHLLEGDRFPETGDEVEIQLMEFIRPETDFKTLDALRLQIHKDIELVRDGLKGAGKST